MKNPRTTPQRLANYRAMAQEYPGTDWRYWRRSIVSTPSNVQRDGLLFSDTVDQLGDYLGDAHTLIRLDHTGWYADSYQEDTIVGGVAKLRCPRGTLYIPVTHCTGWDGATHYLKDKVLVPKGAQEDEHFEAIRDCARWADQHAEREAEKAREYAAKDLAEQEIHEQKKEIHTINQDALPLIKEIKQQRIFPAPVCAAVREKLARLLDSRREAFRRIDALRDDFWIAVN